MDKNLSKIEKLLSPLDEFITNEEFLKAFENVIKQILDMEKKLVEKNNNTFDELKGLHKELVNNDQSDFQYFKSQIQEIINKALKEQKVGLDFLRDKALKIKDFTNGKDGINGIDGIDGKDGKDGSPDTPEQVRDKLESLADGEKLSIQSIQDLDKMLGEIRIKGIKGGGGFSNIAMARHFVDDETPAGTMNGVNKAFTVAKNPYTGSLKVYRNGARQRVTEDYTLSGRTITFIIAPEATEIILVDYRF